jgi:ATP-dependent helicase/DNAse subunit B
MEIFMKTPAEVSVTELVNFNRCEFKSTLRKSDANKRTLNRREVGSVVHAVLERKNKNGQRY